MVRSRRLTIGLPLCLTLTIYCSAQALRSWCCRKASVLTANRLPIRWCQLFVCVCRGRLSMISRIFGIPESLLKISLPVVSVVHCFALLFCCLHYKVFDSKGRSFSGKQPEECPKLLAAACPMCSGFRIEQLKGTPSSSKPCARTRAAHSERGRHCIQLAAHFRGHDPKNICSYAATIHNSFRNSVQCSIRVRQESRRR